MVRKIREAEYDIDDYATKLKDHMNGKMKQVTTGGDNAGVAADKVTLNHKP